MNFDDISTGVDIENIQRFEKYSANDDLVKRVFSQKEIEYCFSHRLPAQHLAVRFSAKEAVYKALSSLNINVINYSDIEITNTDKGVPQVSILKKGFESLKFRLSLSHGNGNALASVIVIKTE
ncbi:MAG: holo-ACP synthase [Candidatus Gastranaerophilaceae bacterium]